MPQQVGWEEPAIAADPRPTGHIAGFSLFGLAELAFLPPACGPCRILSVHWKTAILYLGQLRLQKWTLMNWDDLRLVLAVAREGTLSGAARRLRVTHSTVFRRLGAIGEGLG